MPFKHAMILGGVPSAFMLTSTFLGLGVEVPDDISGALQHFAAGVLLCTVGTELLPAIVNAEGVAQNIAAFVGFFCGVAVLILLGMFSPAEESVPVVPEPTEVDKTKAAYYENSKQIMASEDNKKHSFGSDSEDDFGHFDSNSPTPLQKQELREGRFVIAGRAYRQRQTIRMLMHNQAGRLVLKRSMSLSSLPMVSERDPLLPVSPHKKDSNNGSFDDPQNENKGEELEDKETASTTSPPSPSTPTTTIKQFPIVFVIAVAIDSSLDGLLIGIASIAGKSAGPMMSASLSVEMGFLGLTLATALYGQSFHKAALAALVGPACCKSLLSPALRCLWIRFRRAPSHYLSKTNESYTL